MVSKTKSIHNHNIPLNYDNRNFIVKFRNGSFWIYANLVVSPPYSEPFSENGIDIFLRPKFTEAIKITFENPVDNETRGRVLRWLRANMIPDAVYHSHVAPKPEPGA